MKGSTPLFSSSAVLDWLKPIRKPLVALLMDSFKLHFSEDEPTGTLQ